MNVDTERADTVRTAPEPEAESLGLADQAETASREVAVEQLAAVRSLFGDDRRSTEYDILINAALEVLRNGAIEETRLIEAICSVWPGTGLNPTRVSSAMHAAEKARLVTRSTIDGHAAWALTKAGMDDVESARVWAEDRLDATIHDVQLRLRQAGREVEFAEAARWTGILQHALMAGVRGSFSAYTGDVEHTGLLLLPKHFDVDAMNGVALRQLTDDADTQLMMALLVDAVNPVTAFGSELVTTITVGYMLQAFLGRRDRMHDRALIESVQGDVALLDTPLLLLLLGVDQQSAPIERAIRAAIEAGMEVVVPEHYLDELRELIDTVERENFGMMGRDLGNPNLRPSILAAIVDDGVLRIWADGLATGKYVDWAAFKRAALHMADSLTRFGVRVQAPSGISVEKARAYVIALTEELADRPKPRSPSAIQRDARTMAMVHALRKQESTVGLWPKAWVITFDARMGPAYARIETGEQFQATLTPASWLSLVSNTTPPATSEDLARAASSSLAEETFMRIAARFPIKAAVEIASALGPDNGGSILDVHVAQLSLSDLISRQPNFAMEDSALVAEIGNRVLRLRARWQNASYAEEKARLRARSKAEEEAAFRELSAAKLRLEQERQQIANDADHKVAAAEASAVAAAAQATTESHTSKVLYSRRAVASLATFGLLGLAVAMFLSGAPIVAGFTLLAGVAVFPSGWEWMHDVETRAEKLIVPCAVELVGLLIWLFLAAPWVQRT